MELKVLTTEDSRALDEAAGKFEVLAHTVDNAGDQMRGLVNESEKADHALGALDRKTAETAVEMRVLAHEIEASKARMRELAAEFDRTGNRDLLGQFRAEKGNLSSLTALTSLDREAEQAARKAEQEGKRAARAIEQDMAKAGKEAGDGFATSMSDALSSNPILAIGITAAVLAAVPAAGAALSNAILLGTGGAGLVGGLVLAAKNPAVKAAYGEVGHSILSSLEHDATVLVQPMLYAARIVQDAFSRIEPGIGRIFQMLEPVVTRLATGFGGFLEKAMPGIEKAVSASIPLFNTLGAMLPGLGKVVGQALADLADDAPHIAHDLVYLVNIAEGALLVTTKIVGFLADAFDWLIHAVANVVHFLASVPSQLLGPFAPLHDAFVAMDKDTQRVLTNADNLGKGIGDLSDSVTSLAGDIGGAGGGGLTASVQAANMAFHTMFDNITSLDQASDNWNQGLLNLRKSVQEHGKDMRRNTEDGIANREMLIGLAQNAMRLHDANIAAGMGADQADAAYKQQITDLIALAEKLGLSKTEVEGLLGELLGLPNRIPIEIDLMLNRHFTANDIREVVRAGGGGQLASTPSYAGTGGSYQFRAGGGPVLAGVPYIVGDAGKPEVFVSASDGYIYPDADSGRRAATAGAPRAAAAASRAGLGDVYILADFGDGVRQLVRGEIMRDPRMIADLNVAGTRRRDYATSGL